MNAWVRAAALAVSIAVIPVAGAGADEPARREGLDWSAGFQARAKPLGAIFTGTVGRGFLLWDAGGRWRYGFVRPAVEVESIAVNSRAGVKLDVFPVSILGISLKSEYGVRLLDPATIDCDRFECGGVIRRDSIEARLALEAAGVFGLFGWRWTWNAPGSDGRPFYEDRAVLNGAAGGDASVNLTSIVGYRISDRWSVGVLDDWRRMRGTGGEANMAVAFGRLEKSDWSYVAGAGYYSTNVTPPGPTAVLMVTWTGMKGIGLF